MPQPRLTIRSAHAKELAHRLAKEECCSISLIVERALELYARTDSEARKETAVEFWGRIAREGRVEGEPDIDLQAIIDENRKPHKPIEI